MKRCPECGFRANDKVCPLCGVKMRDLPGAAQDIKTHTHKQSGERCALPNQERKPIRPVVREPVKAEKQPEKKAPQMNFPTKLLPILIVLLFTVLRSCMG